MRKAAKQKSQIIGNIGNEPDMREAPAFTAPTRAIEVSDAAGRLHGRVVWLASEMGADFEIALSEFCRTALDGFHGTPTGGAA